MSQQEKIQLTIRCALQTFSDYNIECSLDWTVLQLKEHLTQICDFNPEPERQRLIYAGHCLKNEQTIKNVLKQQRDGMPRSPDDQLEKQVIHMVYTGKVVSSSVRQRSTAATTSTTNSRNYFSNGQNSSQIQGTNVGVIPMAMPFSNNNFYPTQQQDQQAWMNAYQQYIAQMMPLYQNAAIMPYGVQWPMWNPLSQATFAQQAVFAQFSNATNFGHQQLPNVQQVAPQMPLVANVQQNNEANRVAPDFLDLIYKSIRFILLAMILFLYSSIERFIFVLAMVIIFWFVNARRGRQQRAREGVVAEVAGREAAREAQNQNVEQQQGIQNGTTTPAAEQITPNNAATNAWSIFWGTFQAFFTSLIPENQAPLDVN
ncbi:Ubiquitin-like domain-containing protein [Meloidogyne graminicola]|uniref:Ubiquitin-like domain-containing protein n=1 Tax=Meloidogyne graminicola TaxID=189291 RepID=A0A8T0A247_9BILA|nr:Ubiquitin-like domain-containing protein [Meloidogyne graminicola]